MLEVTSNASPVAVTTCDRILIKIVFLPQSKGRI